MKLIKLDQQTKLLKKGLWSLIIILSLASFAYNGLLKSVINEPDVFSSTDFEFFYAAGKLWNEGEDNYDNKLFLEKLTPLISEEKAHVNNSLYIYFYPPQASVFFGGLAIFPLGTARLVILLLNCLLLLLCMVMLAKILAWYQPLGIAEMALLSSFLATGFARQNIRENQLGLIVFTLLLSTFLLVHTGRQLLGGLSLSIISFKPTFLPLFLGYYLLKRSFRLVIVTIVGGILLTVLPLLLTGRPVVRMLGSLWDSLQLGYVPGGPNDLSPEVPTSATMLHLLPLVFRLFNSQSALASIFCWLLLLICAGSLVYLIWRSRFIKCKEAELLDFGLISALSLLFIYHRVYDNFLLIPGLVYLYIYALRSTRTATRRNWLIFLGVAIFLLCLPADLITQISLKNSIVNLQTTYLGRLIAPFQTWVAIILFGTLLWIKMREVTGRQPVQTGKLTETA